jgi:alpha-tubulin suppressor-like RCC1 family protein
MKLIDKTFFGAGALIAVYGLSTGQARAANPTPPGIPCAARASAVIANGPAPAGQSPPADVFSDAHSLVDSYQSSMGAYGGANVGDNGNVQAATTIQNNGGVIHGTETVNSPAGLAIVPVPAGATNLPLGSASPGSININNAQENITLAPGSYVVANLNVNFPGAINISPPGPVFIWVTGNLNLGGNENLNGIPENLQFLVNSSGFVNVNSNGSLFGFIYAPDAVVNLDSTVFGGVVGSSVTLNSGSAVHFDQNSVCPPPVPTGDTAQIAGDGTELSCALLQNGTVKCWGANGTGQLGIGTLTGPQTCPGTQQGFNPGQTGPCSTTPVLIPGLSGVTALTASFTLACALLSNGTVECWGDNGEGELGIGTSTGPDTCGEGAFAGGCSDAPVLVPGLTGVKQIAAGGTELVCALLAGGTVKCWGGIPEGSETCNEGNGPFPCATSPIPIPAMAGATSLSAGIGGVCAVLANGTGACISDSGVSPVPGLSNASAIAEGFETTCGVLLTGGAACVGGNLDGEAGNGTTMPVATATLVPGLANVTAMTFNGGFTACALLGGGTVQCWGDDSTGELGNGSISTTPVTSPQAVPGLVDVEQIAGGCALLTTGAVECWGDNMFGEAGNGDTSGAPVASPTVVQGL